MGVEGRELSQGRGEGGLQQGHAVKDMKTKKVFRLCNHRQFRQPTLTHREHEGTTQQRPQRESNSQTSF